MNISKICQKTLEILKQEIPGASFDTWVLPLVPYSFESGKFTLLTPHSFTVQTIKLSYSTIITKALTEVTGEVVTFEIIHDKNLKERFEKENKKAKKEERKTIVADFTESKYDGLKQMQSDCHL